jgi:hypothetical protein
VDFGTVAATGVHVVNDTSLTATSPPGSAGAVDVTVITPAGTSATHQADLFTYTVSASPTVVPCNPSCTDAVGTPLDSTGVSVTGSSGTTSPASMSLVVNTGTLACPGGYNYASAVSTFSATGFASTAMVQVTEKVGDVPSAKGVKVCFEKSGAPKAAFLHPCHTGTNTVACVVSVTSQYGGGVVATFMVPANDPRFWTGGAQVSLKTFSPTKGAPGATVTIKGKNLSQVVAVVMGGAQAAIKSATSSKLVVTVPSSAVTGIITVTAASGSVTSSTPFTVN